MRLFIDHRDNEMGYDNSEIDVIQLWPHPMRLLHELIS
jgi:hypothetical protein